MSVAALDPHLVVKTLKAAGFTEEQAEAVTQVVRDSQNLDLSNLATKNDLAELKATMATKVDLAEVKTEMAQIKTNMATKAELAETKVDLIKWVVGIAFAQAGFVLAMLRFMR